VGALGALQRLDDDCDGVVDEDHDADGYGAAAGDCDNADRGFIPGGGALQRGGRRLRRERGRGPDGDGDGVTAACDCDDGRAAVHPGASELCNGLDDDCDGLVDEGAAAAVTAASVVDPGAETSTSSVMRRGGGGRRRGRDHGLRGRCAERRRGGLQPTAAAWSLLGPDAGGCAAGRSTRRGRTTTGWAGR